MKKTLATILAVALVASLCGVMFVSAEETNLALGKTVTGADPKAGSNYTAALTDGNAADAISYDNNWFAYYWNPGMTSDENYDAGANAVEGAGVPVVDLGEVCTVGSVRVNTFLGNASGILAPEYINVDVSEDGENYTQVASTTLESAEANDTTVGWVEFDLETPVSARYVRLTLKNVSTWLFINEIEVYAPASEGGDEPGSTVKPVVPAVKETITVDGKLDDNAYEGATWFSDGIWQSATGATLEDLDVAYTVRSDDDNIYLTIKVNQGVDFATALNPDAWDQSGATNFRIWVLGDGMETRTFYDLLWDGEAFIPHRQKVATEELTFAAETGDDYINLEIAVAKSALNITESFKLMVTYSTPNCLNADGTTAYNAFHMTACDEMPSGWSGTADAYESYNCADIALTTKTPGDEGILVFAVLGLLAIAGAAVTIKSKI